MSKHLSGVSSESGRFGCIQSAGRWLATEVHGSRITLEGVCIRAPRALIALEFSEVAIAPLPLARTELLHESVRYCE